MGGMAVCHFPNFGPRCNLLDHRDGSRGLLCAQAPKGVVYLPRRVRNTFRGLVAAIEGTFAIGAFLGFYVFAVYNITTLATTDYDLVSAMSELVYGTLAYAIVFAVASHV